MHKPLKTLVSVAVIGIMATSAAHAGSFSLYTESSVVALGNYAAGSAAEAVDASTGWYNPAGLALIHSKQAVFGGTGVFPVSKLTGSTAFRTSPNLAYVQSFDGIDGALDAFVPNFHAAMPVGENVTLGISGVAPFGLATDWDVRSPMRYQATLTELITSNISPELGAKVTDNFAVGAGLDLQFARVKFNRILGAPTLFTGTPIPANTLDSISYNKGNSFGVGFHAGVMGMFNDNHTRLGVNYQSVMRHTFHGHSTLTGRLANPGLKIASSAQFFTLSNPEASVRSNELSSNPIELPDIVTVSGYHDVNDTIAVLGSFVWTGWSTFKDIQLNNVVAPSIGAAAAGLPLTVVSVNSTSSQNYKDTWRLAGGINYRLNPLWLIRVGGGYDETPTNDIDRDIRIADVSRWALSAGAHYQVRPTIGLDIGYTHLFSTEDPFINRTDAVSTTSTFSVNAPTGDVGADLVGLQVVWTMDQPMQISSK